MKGLGAAYGQRPLSGSLWRFSGEGDHGLSKGLVAAAAERVFAAGLTLLITAHAAVRSLDLSLSLTVRAAGENILVALVVLGVALGVVRGRHDGEPMEFNWWHALPLLALLLALALRADVPLVHRIAVIIGSAAFVGGLFWGGTQPQEAESSHRAASRFHLAVTALALAIISAFHGLERTPLIAAVELAAGAYLILLAPGIQITYLLIGSGTSSLERLGWGIAISMGAVPVALMWLIWLGIAPTREVVLGLATGLVVVGACLVHLLPDRFNLQNS